MCVRWGVGCDSCVDARMHHRRLLGPRPLGNASFHVFDSFLPRPTGKGKKVAKPKKVEAWALLSGSDRALLLKGGSSVKLATNSFGIQPSVVIWNSSHKVCAASNASRVVTKTRTLSPSCSCMAHTRHATDVLPAKGSDQAAIGSSRAAPPTPIRCFCTGHFVSGLAA